MPLSLHPRHRILTTICLVCTALFAVLHWQQWFLARAEQAACDWLLTNSEARLSPRHPRLAFLALDEPTRSLDTLFAEDLEKSATLRLMKQGFPWNREVYAHILDRLFAAGAQAVLFDLVFPGPREGDEAFRAALERHGARVVLGTNLVEREQQEGGGSGSHVLTTPALQPPPERASWLGFVNVRPDPDGLVRRISYRTTLLEFFGTPAPAGTPEILSLAARGLAQAGLPHRIPATHQPVMFRYAKEVLPRSLHEIFVEAQWQAPPYESGALFRDKIVLIGATGQSSEDRVQTPSGVKIGPEIHLSALNAALNNDFLRETSRLANLGLILGAGLLAWMLSAWVRRPLLRLLLLAVIVFFYQQTAQYLANESGLVVILLSPLLALTTSGLTWAAWEQVLDRVERLRIRRTLERYVGHDVAHEVLDNPATYLNSLGGVRKQVTVLFSDVRGFTTLTEDTDPQALVAQLNEYFEAMVGIVFANHGTLDKFMGDGVMAHWGSIVTEGPAIDTTRAVLTVLQMRQALARLNAGWRARGVREMHVGFGVNHGEAIVGNLGCEAKMEVSVIGDAVNLGSRLEGATKEYHLDFCLGEQAAALIREDFILRSVDLIVVKGKTKPVAVFTVLAKRSPAASEPPWLARHEEAMEKYRAGDFPAAESAWQEVLAAAPGDELARLFLARCAALQRARPEPWSGVFTMQSK